MYIVLFVALSVHLVGLRFVKSNVQSNSQFWINEAIENIKNKLNQPINTNVAKNVIFFMGDGMSISTITAARIHQGQLLNKTGEEHVLSFEKFPASGFSKTYCVNQQISDSGSTSTAYMSGVKGNMYTIGVTSDVNFNDCVAAKDPSNRPTTIIKWAQDAGKATGIVTTARITDASPAGGYAHVPSRKMESDQDVLSNMMNDSCDYDIAKQLVRDFPGKNIKVLMGGGTKKLLSKNKTDAFGNPGQRLDTDLIEEWKNDKLKRNFKPKFITNNQQLNDLDISGTDYLLGLFSTSNMHFHLEHIRTEPTLEEMTTSAIKLLQKEPNGFFLFIEGALIDKAHHGNLARLAVDETVEFAKAVEAATKLTDEKDTLIVVTADHSQPLIINGYAERGNDILGIVSKDVDIDDERNKKSNKSSKHIKRYFTLSYGNGPGYKTNVESDLANDVDIKNLSYKYPSLYGFSSSRHSGEDVPVYARGPWCHLFNGNYEQTVIPIAEAYAAKIGPSKTVKINSSNFMQGQHWLTLFLHQMSRTRII